MTISITISDGPLPPETLFPPPGCGGALVFEGLVRRMEENRPLVALVYETYEPMAQRQIEEIARDLIARHGLLGMTIRHSRGRVRVGEVSFRLAVFSAHRKEALAAADEFIDRLKRDVPFWKRPEWLEASTAVQPGVNL